MSTWCGGLVPVRVEKPGFASLRLKASNQPLLSAGRFSAHLSDPGEPTSFGHPLLPQQSEAVNLRKTVGKPTQVSRCGDARRTRGSGINAGISSAEAYGIVARMRPGGNGSHTEFWDQASDDARPITSQFSRRCSPVQDRSEIISPI